MALPIKIKILDRKFAEFHGFDTKLKYRVQAMDEEGYFIRHPYNDEEINVPFNIVQEFDV